MKKINEQRGRLKTARRKMISAVCFLFFCVGLIVILETHAQQEEIKITPDFIEKEVEPNAQIKLKLNRVLNEGEGRLIVFINETDVSALLTQNSDELIYVPVIAPLPIGENHLKIYRAVTDDDWKEIGDFVLKVKAAEKKEDSSTEKTIENKKTKITFLPQVSVNVKGEDTILFFPETSAPERERFTDSTGQASFNLTVSRSGWTLNNQFDFAASSRKNEALRFGEIGDKASRIDLSSYLVQLEKGRFKTQFGHVSFGSSRHLINSFSSRGVNVTVPITSRDDVSFGFANGTSVVGFNNFFGITRAEHSVTSATYGREFFKEKGKLRVEFTFMRGSLLPLTNFNEGAIVDAERSYGGTLRLKRDVGRLRFDAGFTRSRFTNPFDPTLEQGFEVVPVRAVTRNASYAEISFDVFKDLKLIKNRSVKLTATYRFEELQPLFRSVVASTQADKRLHQFEIVAAFGDINVTYGNLRDRDNLRDVPSILRTLNRNNNLNVNFSLGTIFNQEKPSRFLPRIGYTFSRIHQFGAFLPTNGDFRDASQIPDQFITNHSFAANWELSQKFSFSYQYQRAFIDNRQPGREIADNLNDINTFNFDYKPIEKLTVGANFSFNRAEAFEEPRVDKTFNLGSTITLRDMFLKNSAVTANLTTTIAGDRANLSDNRSGDISLEWSYKLGFGKEKFKKMETQFFIRYNNTYGEQRDNIFFINNFNKRQAFNFGLSFNFF